jgi:hypothetical protein
MSKTWSTSPIASVRRSATGTSLRKRPLEDPLEPAQAPVALLRGEAPVDRALVENFEAPRGDSAAGAACGNPGAS